MEHYYGTLEHDDTKCTQVQWHGMASMFAGWNGVLFSEMKGAWLAEWKIRLQGVGLRLESDSNMVRELFSGLFHWGILAAYGLGVHVRVDPRVCRIPLYYCGIYTDSQFASATAELDSKQ